MAGSRHTWGILMRLQLACLASVDLLISPLLVSLLAALFPVEQEDGYVIMSTSGPRLWPSQHLPLPPSSFCCIRNELPCVMISVLHPAVSKYKQICKDLPSTIAFLESQNPFQSKFLRSFPIACLTPASLHGVACKGRCVYAP